MILFTYFVVSSFGTEAIVQSTSVHTTTSTPQQNCDDLTGRWGSWNPRSDVCVEEYETGDLLTLMRNGTDLYYQIGTGKTDQGDRSHVGFTQQNPGIVGDVEVIGLTGECHKCLGTEVIIMSSVSRSKARGPECGVSDGIRGADQEQYVLTRTGPACRGLALDVHNPNPLLLSKMGVRAKSATFE